MLVDRTEWASIATGISDDNRTTRADIIEVCIDVSNKSLLCIIQDINLGKDLHMIGVSFAKLSIHYYVYQWYHR